MDEDEFLQSLIKEYGMKQRKSPIRCIANAIYEFLEEYHIDLNPMKRERLSLYLVHYRDSEKAAAHIYPIHPGLRKIPKCKKKLAQIIDDISDKATDKDLMEDINLELNQALEEKPVIEQNEFHEVRRKKLSKIKLFNEHNE